MQLVYTYKETFFLKDLFIYVYREVMGIYKQKSRLLIKNKIKRGVKISY